MLLIYVYVSLLCKYVNTEKTSVYHYVSTMWGILTKDSTTPPVRISRSYFYCVPYGVRTTHLRYACTYPHFLCDPSAELQPEFVSFSTVKNVRYFNTERLFLSFLLLEELLLSISSSTFFSQRCKTWYQHIGAN